MHAAAKRCSSRNKRCGVARDDASGLENDPQTTRTLVAMFTANVIDSLT